MAHTKEDLQTEYHIDDYHYQETLKACGLAASRKKLIPREVDERFTVIREYFKQERVSDYQQAASLFQEEKERKETEAESKNMTFSEILATASNDLGKLSLTEAAVLIKACGLSEKVEYPESEGVLIVELWEEMQSGNMTLSEIATEYGGTIDQPQSPTIPSNEATAPPTAPAAGNSPSVTKLVNSLKQLNQTQIDEVILQLQDNRVQQIEQIEQTFEQMFIAGLAARINSGEVAQGIKEGLERNRPPAIDILAVVEQELLSPDSTNNILPPGENTEQ